MLYPLSLCPLSPLPFVPVHASSYRNSSCVAGLAPFTFALLLPSHTVPTIILYSVSYCTHYHTVQSYPQFHKGLQMSEQDFENYTHTVFADKKTQQQRVQEAARIYAVDQKTPVILIHSYTRTLVHSYTRTLAHSHTRTLIHSYTHTLKHYTLISCTYYTHHLGMQVNREAKDYTNYWWAATHMNGDYMFSCPTRRTARALAKYSTAQVWHYYFAHTVSPNQLLIQLLAQCILAE
jgi:hypothetical protein